MSRYLLVSCWTSARRVVEVTDAGVRDNVRVAIRYIESWLRGIGAVAIDNLMEDAATAEISRSQLWQWIHQDTVTAEGHQITVPFVEAAIALTPFERWPGDRFDDAIAIFRTVALEEEFPTFLTLTAYANYLVEEPVLTAV